MSLVAPVRARASGAAYRVIQRTAPRVYLSLAARRGADLHRVTAGCDLVIVGYPGSANSFARAAVLQANPTLRVASHGHVWTEAADGVRLGVPTLVIVREPIGAVSSRLARFGNVSPAAALSDYARLYEPVRALKQHVVVVDFADVTQRFGDVLRRVNAAFGTSFASFRHDEADTVRAMLAMLADANGAVPSADRAAASRAAAARLDAPRLRRRRARCAALYCALVGEQNAATRPSTA